MCQHQTGCCCQVFPSERVWSNILWLESLHTLCSSWGWQYLLFFPFIKLSSWIEMNWLICTILPDVLLPTFSFNLTSTLHLYFLPVFLVLVSVNDSANDYVDTDLFLSSVQQRKVADRVRGCIKCHDLPSVCFLLGNVTICHLLQQDMSLQVPNHQKERVCSLYSDDELLDEDEWVMLLVLFIPVPGHCTWIKIDF